MTNRKQTIMDKKTFIKLTFLFTIMLGTISCIQETKSNGQTVISTNVDTIIIKHKNELNQSYEVGFYSKSYSYYWLVGKDTLDFVVNAIESEKDSTLNLTINHKKPLLFSTALTKINDCYPIIKKDFQLSKLNSFYFKNPIYYVDFAKELSTEYELHFGRKRISYDKLNQFLLNSKLSKELDNLVDPLDKKIAQYGIEKFHLMNRKYYKGYFPDSNVNEYPEFIISGTGFYVQLANKKE